MKVAIYCRLSEEDRNKQFETDDSNSIQNQKAMLLQYAMEQGWELYNIYSDDDYTGSDRRRPEFNRLLKDAEQHRFDIILCKTQSRFTRELELVEKYIHGLFPIWGIRFISIVDNADTANKGNKKSRQINGLVNEWYLEDMSLSVKFLPYFHKVTEKLQSPVCSMTGAYQIQQNISVYTACVINSRKRKTVPSGNTLLFPIC